MNLNTILAPVYWELIEPEKGKFDFELLDRLIAETRKNELKMIISWLGTMPNSWRKSPRREKPSIPSPCLSRRHSSDLEKSLGNIPVPVHCRI
ncbi:beta-galactosidase [Flagellimonas crocea]|uniref:beta-galactosidase n=1 Tax=Flagellimonas crocea TaxID=3067311 RepID=UPI00384B172E